MWSLARGNYSRGRGGTFEGDYKWRDCDVRGEDVNLCAWSREADWDEAVLVVTCDEVHRTYREWCWAKPALRAPVALIA